MVIAERLEPLTADDDEIRRALEDAFLPAILPALAHATGDISILRPGLLPERTTPGAVQGGMTPEQQQQAKEIAFAALKRLRDSTGITPLHTEADLRAILAWMTNGKASDDYIPLLLEELSPDQDFRAPKWRMPAGTAYSVAIVGAGMSGILAGIRLKQAGVPFTIFEKNDDVGGTWYDNTYPGARVDVPNHFYSYSFAQKPDWPKYFSTQETLLDYFRSCCDDFGIRASIRFRTEVTSADWDDERAIWRLTVRGADGAEETVETNALICATGQLNRPRYPEVEGRDTFAGPAFHSARWDHSVDLHGKRVAVIGNGASAAQFVPIIAEQVAELTIFQRTPNWFVPVPTYHDDVADGLRWLMRRVPYYAHWYRFWMFWNTTEGLLAAATVDENWPDKSKSISQESEMLRMLLAGYLQAQFADRPDLLEKVMPQYPPGAKRMILDNGVWAAALKRPNVHLVTDRIARITPSGVVTADGTEHAADILIYATGFMASEFMTPMRVRGRGGLDLWDFWGGDARAYLGVVVPHFPSFFMMYGPNTNIVVNGSITYFSECEMQYILGCLRLVLEGKHRALDCRQDVYEAYNVRIDEENKKRAWGVSGVPSWYKNAKGRVSQNWPFNAIEYWQQTREPNPADFELL
ncbi:MAG TPA: NAD(P)/FAD-dependent oxidoreductase [Dehalococcoidia bacterium]|nr:NAD(P)/FAD-dependent oxidoreductase [Dehalococcoidia bacterium]